jgi:hypothetical protein
MSWFPSSSTPLVAATNPSPVIRKEDKDVKDGRDGNLLPSASVSHSLSTSPGLILVRSAKGVTSLESSGSRSRTKAHSQSGDGKLFNTTGLPQFMKVPSNEQIFRVNVGIAKSTIVSSVLATSFAALYFSGSDYDDFASMSQVFDQYRIAMIEVFLIPNLSTTISVSQDTGMFVSVLDYDDYNPLTTYAQALDYENCLFGSGLEGHYRKFVPHVAIAAYSGTFVSFVNETAPWIDMASPTVQHYGLKTAWTVTDSAYTYRVHCRYHFEFRNVR